MKSLHGQYFAFLPTAVALLVCIVLTGCGDAQRATVSGVVTLDGKPIPGATIIFLPTQETAAPASGGAIGEDGTYTVTFEGAPSAGDYRVEIRGIRHKTGRMIPAPPPLARGTMIEECVELIPDWYNKKSELLVELKRGDNQHDFALVLKK